MAAEARESVGNFSKQIRLTFGIIEQIRKANGVFLVSHGTPKNLPHFTIFDGYTLYRAAVI